MSYSQKVLVFTQQNDNKGTCICTYNGIEIDRCEMNFVERYTQAHIVVRKVLDTLGHGNFGMKFIPCQETLATVDIYGIGTIVEMAGDIEPMSKGVYEKLLS